MAASLNLLCLPCAGASATMYLRWRRQLPQWMHLVPVELPGRGGRLGEPAVEDFAQMVALVCREQRSAIQGRFVLFGHSMGALLAFGMARHLRATGRELPLAVVASGSSAPSRRDPERFARKGDDEALIADLRKQGGTPEDVFASPELMRITLDVLGADYRVCESFAYAAEPPLPMPLHVFAGREDDIAAERMDAWSAETATGFSLDWFDGGHFFIKQHEARVLSALQQRLAWSVAGESHASRAHA
ncbi:alpha/beta fold hydrolase [Acidovorax sp. SUPP2825]|uniref:thioesterase II family protein n=1 Tax=Acidovorax sp. SUPP2825 TaxID=2920879 RepID=UPI0024E0C41B|nr:alpha/beta fold hydrolase [Acidovorax sp. SUPP2825]